MKKKNILYQCQECGYETTGYFGKCPSCGSWGTLEEKISDSNEKDSNKRKHKSTPRLISEIDAQEDFRIQTSIGELNRVMGQGIVKDSVNILTAKPGAGKSTLLLQLAQDLGANNLKILYVSGEESESQIKNRANRLDIDSDNIYILSTNSLNSAEEAIKKIGPDILIFDSIQTIIDSNLTQRPGSPTQINQVSNKIVELSKYSNKKRASFIVAQMTKQDELAGVRTLEHLVDCVLILETGDTDQMRILSSSKNRYGNTGEIGFFEMTEKGLVSIDNPSEYFVSKDPVGFGKALTVLMNGSRNIVCELESLVSSSYFPYPQRISESVGKNNFNIIASVLEQVSNLKLEDKNIILKTTGGIKVVDVSADLAIAMSIASSYFKTPIASDTVFLGELGLTGQVKKIQNINSRINEARRLNYKNIVISNNQGYKNKHEDLNIIEISNIDQVIKKFFLD